jgi:hypothetical protein
MKTDEQVSTVVLLYALISGGVALYIGWSAVLTALH